MPCAVLGMIEPQFWNVKCIMSPWHKPSLKKAMEAVSLKGQLPQYLRHMRHHRCSYVIGSLIIPNA